VIGDLIDDTVVRPLSKARKDTDTHALIETRPGGGAGNFASWLATLDVTVDLVCRIAQKDLVEQQLKAKSYGINPLFQADQIHPTGAIIAIVDAETRSFFTQRGANDFLELDQIANLESYDLVYLSGYTIASQKRPEAVTEFLEACKRSKVSVAIDPGSAGFISDYSVGSFMEIIAGADYLFPSLEEGALISGFNEPRPIIDALAKSFGTVVLKLGAQGALYKSQDTLIEVQPIDVSAIDPTGAGDAFAAGFIAQLLNDQAPNKALRQAAILGALAVTIIGGRPTNNLIAESKLES
jgi:sugar/nucleoside kinase (ribokinase family)